MTVHKESTTVQIVETVRWQIGAGKAFPPRRSVELRRTTIPGGLVDGYRMVGEMINHRVIIGMDHIELGTRDEALEILELLTTQLRDWPAP